MFKKISHDKISFSFVALVILTSFILAILPFKETNPPYTEISQFGVFKDSSNLMTIEEVIKRDADFIRLDKHTLYTENKHSTSWVRCLIQPQMTGNGGRFLEINNAGLEIADIYFLQNEVIHIGKRIDSRTIPLKTRVWNIEIPASITENVPIYIRFDTTRPMIIPIRVVNTAEMINSSLVNFLLFGLFYGVLIAVFFVNLFSFLILKNKNFFICGLFIIVLFLYQLRIQGFLYFIPMPFQLLEAILWLSLGASGIIILLFTKRFLNLKKRLPKVDTVLRFFIPLILVQTLVGVFISGRLANLIACSSSIVIPVIVIIASFKIYLSGYREARYIILSWAIYFSSTLLWASSTFVEGRIPSNYFFIIGTSAQALLLTLSIFDQIKYELKEKEVIAKSEKYYIDLSRTDSLTGLYNRRYLNDLLRRLETENSDSNQHAIIMVDLDNFKVINDTYGHPTGDKVLINVATKIQKFIRKTDIACRYGGDEFLIYLPGADSKIAQIIGERICTDICTQPGIFTDSGEPITHSVSIGITESRLDDSFEANLLRADAALYKAKNMGRNCVSVL